jgi:cell division protein FtsW
VFSSTPRLANDTGSDRITIMVDQLKVVAIGFFLIFTLYFVGRADWYKKVSMLGYGASLIVLIILVLKLNLGFVRAGEVNGAWRVLVVAGKQIHIYEFVKLFMIMYLGWALDSFKSGEFKWAPRLAQRFEKLAFLEKDIYQKILYIYFPILSTTLLVMMGSNSSAIFIGIIMVLMVLVGGIDWRDIGVVVAVGLVGIALMFGAYKAGWLKESRIGTAIGRITQDDEATMRQLISSKRESPEWRQARGKLDQPVGALLAIKEGGVWGKGIGRSTQKYQVPVIFGDYMFSFIVEEYGLMGGILVIILYISLLARGSIIVRNCDNHFAKTAIAGLVVLITGQAMMHIMINCDLGPLTGQTLPMVSLGKSSFLMFSLAFGIILSISRIAKRKIAREAESMGSIMGDGERSGARNEMESTLEDLDEMESSGFEGTGVPVHENDIPDYGIDDHNNE